MAVLGSGYSVSRASGVCSATQRPFALNEVFVAALVDAPGVGMSRVDFSLEAWEAGARPQPPFQLFGFWKAHYHTAPQPKKNLLDDTELLEMFENLAGATDAKQIRFRYMLALLLIRRRLIRVVGTKRTKEATIMSIYRRGEVTGSVPPAEVIDPGLDDMSIADAMEQLSQLMETDAPPSESAARKPDAAT